MYRRIISGDGRDASTGILFGVRFWRGEDMSGSGVEELGVAGARSAASYIGLVRAVIASALMHCCK